MTNNKKKQNNTKNGVQVFVGILTLKRKVPVLENLHFRPMLFIFLSVLHDTNICSLLMLFLQ